MYRKKLIFVFLITFLKSSSVLAQTCTYYPNSDLSVAYYNFEPGTSINDCCRSCYYAPECVAFTWDTYYAGTCYLRSSVGTLVNSSDHIVGICDTNATVVPPLSINKCTLQYNTDIPGFDIANFANNQPNDCCNLCFLTQGCKAYTWSTANNGTCFLKSATGPTSANNNMIASTLTPAVINWKINETYDSTNFFNKFVFFTGNDPTNGFVDYVGRSEAEVLGIITINNNGTIYIGTDHTNVIQGGSRGRPSTRITSNTAYNGGLFILDLIHMPVGPGTWPAYWFLGPDWPDNGEADILEGIGGNAQNTITLHTGDGCTMRQEYNQLFTGSWADGNTPGVPSVDCYIHDPSQKNNGGCSINGAQGTYGDQFNAGGGGVVAYEWEKNDYMRVWVFARNAIPTDIQQGNPNPSNWGRPAAAFLFGTNCNPVYFNNMNLIFDLTFCGDWAGNAYQGGNGACVAEVQLNPQNYTDAYWLINYIKVYQNGLESCIADFGSCQRGQDCCSGLCFNGQCS